MGILVTGSFKTTDGVPYTQAYCRIQSYIVECNDAPNHGLGISYRMTYYITQEAKLSGSPPFTGPPIECNRGFQTTLAESISYPGGIFAMVYADYQKFLTDSGYTFTQVLESGQTPV